MKKLIYLFISVSLLYSCSTGETSDSDNKSSDTLSELVDFTPMEANTSFKLPSPVELYILIKDEGAVYRQEELHSIDLASNYMTNEKKAINFGVYASDLAYCTVFAKQQETQSYFKTLKGLAEGLGIGEAYDADVVKRIDENLYNSDSLYNITSDSYWEVCTYLEENDKADVLSQILLGGWTESVYLAINSVDGFDPENEIIIRITEQSFLLENLIEYLKGLKKEQISRVYLEQLLGLQYSFDKLIDNPENVIITKDQYKEIVSKVSALRADLIK